MQVMQEGQMRQMMTCSDWCALTVFGLCQVMSQIRVTRIRLMLDIREKEYAGVAGSETAACHNCNRENVIPPMFFVVGEPPAAIVVIRRHEQRAGFDRAMRMEEQRTRILDKFNQNRTSQCRPFRWSGDHHE